MSSETVQSLAQKYGMSQAKVSRIAEQVGLEQSETVLQYMVQNNVTADEAVARLKDPQNQGQYDRSQHETFAANQLLQGVQQDAADILNGYQLALQTLVDAGRPAVKAKVMQSAFSQPTVSVVEQMKAYLLTNTVNDYCSAILEPTKNVLSLPGVK